MKKTKRERELFTGQGYGEEKQEIYTKTAPNVTSMLFVGSSIKLNRLHLTMAKTFHLVF